VVSGCGDVSRQETTKLFILLFTDYEIKTNDLVALGEASPMTSDDLDGRSRSFVFQKPYD